METGKSGLESVPVHIGSVAAQQAKRVDVQTPLTAVYIHAVPAYPQPPPAAQDPATLRLAMPAMYPKETLPVLTLHIAGGLPSQPGLGLAAAAPPAKPKSAGKHVCPHCGRDCMKPSVLEKHLRCHTGERPYPCTTCGVSFKTQSNLYKHRRTQAHARLSSESEHSSLDSMSSSRETCSSSLSLDERSDELGSVEKNTTQSTTLASTKKTFAVQTQSSVNELKERSSLFLKAETIGSGKVSMEEDKQMMENARPPLTVSRHLPLQRQEALLFSKHWESSVSRGKSQNHESTDSGFSESSDHYPSPSSALPEHSMEFLTESNQENPEASPSTHESSEKCNSGQEPRVREQEQKLLEERISKLISENTAVVEDKQLENVRPRKTVLSKQGSIDLPMPYTYKDSFHFDMRNNPTQNMGSQRYRSGLYSSVPTQCSSTVERAPLTRSSSLPFSVSLLPPERSSSASSNQSDYVTLVRRGSSGQVNPSSFALRPVSQHSSTHRPLVRQSAVDCNHATDGLFTNPSVEEASTGSLSCDGDGGDICEEPNTRRVRRKKSQNVSYKWYMYRGGTFERFYNEKNGDRNTVQGRKCSISSEVAQGLQKATSVVHKETVTTTGSTINNTKSRGMEGHHSASFPSNSSVDLNVQSSHLDSSIKAPPRRNASLSLLPLLTTGSTVSYKTEGVNTTEAGRLIHLKKHGDCASYLCGAHMPSDRKKQKTDNKVIPHMEMLTDLNTVTHPPLSVTGTLPQLDTNLTFFKLQNNPEHTELRGALFLPSQLDANELSVSSSQTTSTPSAAKNSFLPKYQLKLPNAPEPDSKHLQQVEDKPKGYHDCTPSPSLLSTPTDRTLPTKNFGNAISFSLMETCAKNKVRAVTSTQGQFVLSRTVPTLYQSGTSKLSQGLASNQGLVHRQFAAPTKTTSCLQDYQTGLCSTLIRPLKTSENSIPSQLPRPNASAAASEPSTAANNQTFVNTTVTPSPSYLSLIPPLSHAQPSPASGWTNPGNGPLVPCPVTPYGQPAPKVFHVRTTDLQICLQIISDEQLALIAPQIERPLNTGLSQKCEIEGMSSEVVQKKSHSFVTQENSNEEGNDEQPGNQNKTDEGKPSPELSTERITPSVPVQFVQSQPGPPPAQDSNATPAAASDESNLPPGSSSHPHTGGHVNKVTQTRGAAGDVMSTEASLRSVNSEESQTSEVEQAFSWSCSADGQFFPDKRVSQDGKVSQNLSGQHKLSVSSLSTQKVNQDGLKSEQLAKESQPSPQTRTQAAPCNAGTLKSRRLQSVEILSQGNSAACADESLPSFSINKYKASKKLNPQASTHCSHPEERTLSESPNPSIHPGIKSNRLGRLDKVSPSLETTTCKSQDEMNSGHPETPVNQSTSPFSDIQPERPKDSRTVCSTNQHPDREGVSLAESGARKDLHTLETESLCRCTVTKLEGEDTNAQMDSFRSEQSLHYCSQAHSGLCECPSPPSKQTPISSNILNFPSSSVCASQSNSLLQEINHFEPSQQNWRSGIISDQHTRVLHESSFSQHVIAHSHLSQTGNLFSRTEPCLQQTHSVSHEPQKLLSADLSTQPENTDAGHNNTATGSSYTLTSGSHRNPRLSPDFTPLSSTHQSPEPQFCRTTRFTSKSDRNTGSPLTSFTYLEAKEKHDSLEVKPNEHRRQSSECGRPDITSKYQSVLMAECVTGGVRPVLSCYTEDTSSSDDEGKLIIEL